MASGAFIRGLGMGLAGAVILGVVLRDLVAMAVGTTEDAGDGKERPEFHNIVVWDRLAEVSGRYLGKGQQVAIEGRLQTRTWDDERRLR